MSLKRDLKTLNEFTDNPYDAKYRPEKEMRKFFILLMILLPILLGLFRGFWILAAGPLSIYWIVMFVKSREYWKALGWKTIWWILPTVIMGIVGIVLAVTGAIFSFFGWIFNNLFFYV